MRNLVLAPLVLLAVSSCAMQSDAEAERLARSKDETLVNPAQRYSIATFPKADGVFVLDSRLGKLRFCAASAPDDKDWTSVSVVCTEPTFAG